MKKSNKKVLKKSSQFGLQDKHIKAAAAAAAVAAATAAAAAAAAAAAVVVTY